MSEIFIKGVVFKRVNNKPPFASFNIYHVQLRGGPYDGVATLAGNTREVFHEEARYFLQPNGEFHFVDQPGDLA